MDENKPVKPTRHLFKSRHIVLLILLLFACIGFIAIFLRKSAGPLAPIIYQPDTTRLAVKPVAKKSVPEPVPVINNPHLPEPPKFLDSPDGRYTTYIEPLEWEVTGNVYLKEIKTGEIRQLSKYPANSSETPKKLAWLNDTLLLSITGYTYGSNAVVGGALHLYYIRTGDHIILYNPPPNKDVAEVSVQGKNIVLRIANWDKNFNNYTLSSLVLQVDSVIKSISRSIVR